MRPRIAFPDQAGLSLPMIVFIIIVIGLLATAMAMLLSAGSRTAALNTLATRAYFAAQSGAQWGVYQLSPAKGKGKAASACFPDTMLNFNAAGLESCNTAVSCTSAADRTGNTVNFRVQSVGTCTAGAYGAQRNVVVGTSRTQGAAACIQACDNQFNACIQNCPDFLCQIDCFFQYFDCVFLCSSGGGKGGRAVTTSLRYWLEQNQ